MTNSAVGKGGCYAVNVGELLNEVDGQFFDDEGKFIELDFDETVKLLQIVWDKVKETAQECEGKEITVKLPQGVIGGIIAAALSVVGFKL